MITYIQPYSQGAQVNIFTTTIDWDTYEPTATDSRWSVYLDGSIKSYTNSGPATTIGTWLLSGVNSDYEIRATEVSQSGSATRTGTLNTWMVMSSDRTWRVTKTSGTGTADWVLLMEVRRVSDSTVIDTATITLSGTRTAMTVVLETNMPGPGWTPVSDDVNNPDIEHFGFTPGPEQTSYSLRAVVTGGTPPYTYAWTKTSGSFEWSIDSPTADQTTFTVDSAGNGWTIENARINCEVTDNLALTANPTLQGRIRGESDV